MAALSSDRQAALGFLERTEPCKWLFDGEQRLVGFEGREYSILHFETKLHKEIVFQLRDAEKSQRIWNAYKKHIEGLDSSAREIFDQWLLENIYLLGCEKERHARVLGKDNALIPHKQPIARFLTDVCCVEHSHTPERELKRVPRIAIITTSTAGGEWMTALSVEAWLKSQAFCVQRFDIREIEKEKDPLYVYSAGRFHQEDIWSEVFQKEGNTELSDHLYWVANSIRHFIENNLQGYLKKALALFNPDLIISMLSYLPDQAALAYDLNVPVRYVHCDFHFNPYLEPIVCRVNPQLVKFWVPATLCTPRTGLSKKELQARVKILGYPIRAGIKKESDPVKLAEIRKKYGVDPNEKVVIMQMGRQGMGKVLQNLVEKMQIIHNPRGRLYIAVVCGQNAILRQAVLEKIQSCTYDPAIRFQVYGFLEEAAITELYNIGHLVVGKAGGSITAEILKMQLFALVYSSQPMEVPNVKYLVQVGVGLEMDVENSFVDQLLQLLDRAPVQTEVVDWQMQILSLLPAAFRKFQQKEMHHLL